MKEQPYVFRHFENCEHKEDVFLAVLQLLVFKVPVGLGVSQGKFFGQDFEVSSNIGFGFCLPPEPEPSARLVYLFEQLQWGARSRQLITRSSTHMKSHLPKPNQSISVSFFFFFLIAELNTLIARSRRLQKRSVTYFIFFLQKIWKSKIVWISSHIKHKTVEFYPTVSNDKKRKRQNSFTTYRAQLLFSCWYDQKHFCLRWPDEDKSSLGRFFLLDLMNNMQLFRISQFIYS